MHRLSDRQYRYTLNVLVRAISACRFHRAIQSAGRGHGRGLPMTRHKAVPWCLQMNRTHLRLDRCIREVGRLSEVYVSVSFGQLSSLLRSAPVLESVLKKEDFPTFGRPVDIDERLTTLWVYTVRTDDTDLEGVGWATEKDLLLGLGGLLRGHLLFYRGANGRGGRKISTGKERRPGRWWS